MGLESGLRLALGVKVDPEPEPEAWLPCCLAVGIRVVCGGGANRLVCGGRGLEWMGLRKASTVGVGRWKAVDRRGWPMEGG